MKSNIDTKKIVGLAILAVIRRHMIRAAIILGVLFYLILFDDIPWKGVVFHYVKNHQAELETVVDEGEPEPLVGKEAREYWKGRLGQFTIVKDVTTHHENGEVMEFFCGGSLGTTYVGFFYSAKDDPRLLDSAGELTEVREGQYKWISENGRKRIYSERICENWFYYWWDWY